MAKNKISLSDIIKESKKPKSQPNNKNVKGVVKEKDSSFNNKPNMKDAVNEMFLTTIPYAGRSFSNQRTISEKEISKFIGEGISSQAVDRMDGLVNLEEFKKFKRAIVLIVNELEDEGFEKDEIAEYLKMYIKKATGY